MHDTQQQPQRQMKERLILALHSYSSTSSSSEVSGSLAGWHWQSESDRR